MLKSGCFKILGSVAIIIISLYFTSCHSRKKVTTKKDDTKTDVSSNNSAVTNCVATLLAVNERDLNDKKLYRFVCEWYGTPYKFGGCDKKGTDCSCFTNILVSQVYQKKLPRTAGEMLGSCEKVNSSPKEGDLVFFKINGNSISHVGVFLRNNKFIHASTSKGVIINDINDSYYKKYFYCYGRLK